MLLKNGFSESRPGAAIGTAWDPVWTSYSWKEVLSVFSSLSDLTFKVGICAVCGSLSVKGELENVKVLCRNSEKPFRSHHHYHQCS